MKKNMKQTTQAVLWCRVSSKEQEDTGYSLPSQEKLLVEYCHRKEITDYKVFSVSESASGKVVRQNFQAMFAYIKQHNVSIVVCEKADRITRNFNDMVTIDAWLEEDEKREVHLVKDSLVLHSNSKSQEKLNWGIRILFAKNYIDNLGEEVKKGQKQKLKDGWLPTRPPIGYKTVGQQGHKIHVIDTDTAPLVKKMFTLYATGNYSLKNLENEVGKIGLISSGGKKLYKSRIHALLQDKFYIGTNVWNGIEYPGKQETFISEELFEKVQSVMSGGNKPPHITKHNHLFKSFFKCGECAGTITWEIQKGITYGHCNHYQNCTTKKWAREDLVEKQVVDSLKALVIRSPSVKDWLRQEIKISTQDESELHLTSIEQYKKQLEVIEKRLQNLYIDHLDEKIAEAQYQNLSSQFQSEKKELLKQISQSAQQTDQARQTGLSLYDLAQGGATVWSKSDTQKRQLLMRLVFDKLTLTEEQMDYQYSKGMEILQRVVAQTNSSKLAKRVEKMEKTFEPRKKIDLAIQSDAFAPYRSAVLPD